MNPRLSHPENIDSTSHLTSLGQYYTITNSISKEVEEKVIEIFEITMQTNKMRPEKNSENNA